MDSEAEDVNCGLSPVADACHGGSRGGGRGDVPFPCPPSTPSASVSPSEGLRLTLLSWEHEFQSMGSLLLRAQSIGALVGVWVLRELWRPQKEWRA